MSERIDKKVAGKIFQRIAELLELSGENEFKTRAYQQAARRIETFPGSLSELLAEASQGKLKGVGPALFEKLETLVRTGELPYLDELEESFPTGLTELLEVPGLGAKSVRKLYKTLGIETLSDLEASCKTGSILAVPGFSDKSRNKILQGIRNLKSYEDRFRLQKAQEAAALFLEESKGILESPEIVGSLRRRCETVHDVDFLALGTASESLRERLQTLPSVENVTMASEAKFAGTFQSGIPFEIRFSTPEKSVITLIRCTGNKDHIAALDERATKSGWKLTESGLLDPSGHSINLKSEEEFYGSLGLSFIPAELRENNGEIEAAAQGRLPSLLRPENLVGIIHAHTLYSDGTAGIAGMAETAQAMGFRYLAISDHSKSSTIANGMKEDAILRQHEEIDRYNSDHPSFRILKGVESDILKDGSLDYPDRVLASFDFIIASVHSNFGMNSLEMTNRIVNSVRNPYTTILGHPTGRILLHREPYQVDMLKVIEACAECGCAIEINANPYRLDLDWRLVRTAIDAGVKLAIGPDAHSEDQLRFATYGVDVARKGWATPKDVLNCLVAEDFLNFAAWKRKASGEPVMK